MANIQPALFQQELRLLHAPKQKSLIKVLDDQICISEVSSKPSNRKEVILPFCDIIGVDCLKGRKENDTACYLSLYCYQHKKKVIGRNTTRNRRVITLVFDANKEYSSNLNESMSWKQRIQKLLRKEECKHITADNATEYKKWLFLVNPKSGPGKALSIFEQRVVPMLAEAGIEYKVVVTDHAGHGSEIMKRLQLNDWYCVVIVSGDGLIFEVINGIMARNDWQEAIRFPVGCLPGGSGNALSCAISHAAREPYLEAQVLHSAYLLIKHQQIAMDLVAVELASGKRLYSFLSVAWGIISDVDIESEKYRSLGNFRFTLGAVMSIMSLRKYRGRVSFLPCDKYTPRPTTTKLLRRSQSEYAQHRQDGSGVQVTSVKRGTSMVDSKRHLSTAAAQSGEGAEGDSRQMSRVDSIAEEEEPKELVAVNASGDTSNTGTDVDQPKFGLDFSGDEATGGAAAKDASESAVVGPETPLLAPLSEPVPNNWVSIEDEFITVVAAYLSHLGPDLIIDPKIRLGEDDIYLVMVKHNATRTKVLKLFLDMADGSADMNTEGLELVRVKAFRIEPFSETGHMTVDGELVEYGPVQGQIMPKMANIMGRETRL